MTCKSPVTVPKSNILRCHTLYFMLYPGTRYVTQLKMTKSPTTSYAFSEWAKEAEVCAGLLEAARSANQEARDQSAARIWVLVADRRSHPPSCQNYASVWEHCPIGVEELCHHGRGSPAREKGGSLLHKVARSIKSQFEASALNLHQRPRRRFCGVSRTRIRDRKCIWGRSAIDRR